MAFSFLVRRRIVLVARGFVRADSPGDGLEMVTRLGVRTSFVYSHRNISILPLCSTTASECVQRRGTHDILVSLSFALGFDHVQ